MEQNNTFILAISDSHGGIANVVTVLKWAQSTCIHTFDAAIFLGDGFEDISPASARAGFSLPWHAVRGNVDYQTSINYNMILEIPAKNPELSSSRKLFLSHGNRYRVEEDFIAIASVAQDAGADAVIFGHTHVPYCATENGIFLLNPGSISRPRSNAGCTFAVLECPDSGPLSATFFQLTEDFQCREITLRG